MILKKAIVIATSVAALAAAAGVCVVSLAFALYAAVLPALGAAWAAATVALVAALLVGLGALIAMLRSNPPKRGEDHRDLSVRAFDLAREKPVIAAVAIIAAGVVALRSPKITAALVGAFMAGRAPKK